MAPLPGPLTHRPSSAGGRRQAVPADRPGRDDQVKTNTTRRDTTMRRQLHWRWVGVISALALLLGSWGAVPVLAARNAAGGPVGGEPPEAYSPIQVVAAVLKLSDDQVHTLVQVQAARAAS